MICSTDKVQSIQMETYCFQLCTIHMEIRKYPIKHREKFISKRSQQSLNACRNELFRETSKKNLFKDF